MRDLGTLGGPSSQAGGDAHTGGHAINDRGEVVGSSLLANRNKQGDYTSEHAFLWRNGRLRDIGTLGGLNSRAVAINPQGLIIGESETTNKQPSGWPYTYPGKLAFVWSQGHMRRLSLGGMDSWTEAINARGQVIGWSQLKERDSKGHTIYHAFVWQRGRIRDIGRPGTQVINDRGQIFGSTGRSWSLLENGRVSPLADCLSRSGALRRRRSMTEPRSPGTARRRTPLPGIPCLWEHGSVRFLGSLRGSSHRPLPGYQRTRRDRRTPGQSRLRLGERHDPRPRQPRRSLPAPLSPSTTAARSLAGAPRPPAIDTPFADAQTR